MLMFGTVLRDGETAESAEVVERAGPAVAVMYHALYDAAPESLDNLPGGPEWRADIEQVPAASRHLAIHDGHLVALTDRDRAAVGPMISMQTLTPEQVRERVAGLAAGGRHRDRLPAGGGRRRRRSGELHRRRQRLDLVGYRAVATRRYDPDRSPPIIDILEGDAMAGSYIVAGARTPIGKMSGALAGFSAAELGARRHQGRPRARRRRAGGGRARADGPGADGRPGSGAGAPGGGEGRHPDERALGQHQQGLPQSGSTRSTSPTR